MTPLTVIAHSRGWPLREALNTMLNSVRIKKSSVWDTSYKRGDNVLFQPNEEIVRFINNYVKKRTGPNQFVDISPLATLPALDLGCGAGRHCMFLQEMGFHVIGVDHSEVALELARQWLLESKNRLRLGESSFHRGDTGELNFIQSKSIGTVVSHGVLDSMTWADATSTVQELERVVADGGLVYADFISQNDYSYRSSEISEITVETEHERGTVQNFFDEVMVRQLFSEKWDIVSLERKSATDVISGLMRERFHIVARRETSQSI